jgi:hypothetical protein
MRENWSCLRRQPQSRPTADVYKALEKDSIQITMTDIFGVIDLWRVAGSIVNTKHSPSLFIVVINNKAWEVFRENTGRSCRRRREPSRSAHFLSFPSAAKLVEAFAHCG